MTPGDAALARLESEAAHQRSVAAATAAAAIADLPTTHRPAAADAAARALLLESRLERQRSLAAAASAPLALALAGSPSLAAASAAAALSSVEAEHRRAALHSEADTLRSVLSSHQALRERAQKKRATYAELIKQLELAERCLLDSQSSATRLLRDNESLRQQVAGAAAGLAATQAAIASSDLELDRLRSLLRAQGRLSADVEGELERLRTRVRRCRPVGSFVDVVTVVHVLADTCWYSRVSPGG